MTRSVGKTVVGVDVGGTKCAAGLVDLETGQVSELVRCLTEAERGGQAVLDRVCELIKSLQAKAKEQSIGVSGIGLGIAELVNRVGEIQSSATIHWQSLVPSVREQIRAATGLEVHFEADVRAAARAEARWGHGRDLSNFLFVSVGTGISAALVVDGQPYRGARGLTGTFASAATLWPTRTGSLGEGMALEMYSSGAAISRRLNAVGGDSTSPHTEQILEWAAAGRSPAQEIVVSAAHALGASIAQLVNMLDPSLVVLGGGLGSAPGLFRREVELAMRRHIWSDLHRDLPLLGSALGANAGVVGAALAAGDSDKSAA